LSAEELVSERTSLLRLARYWTRDATLAEDLVQATLLIAMQSMDTWKGRGPLRNWLIRILANQVKRRARMRETQTEDVAAWDRLAADAGWAADSEFDRAERSELLQQALLSLAEADREVLLLRDVEGLGGEEAAELLGVPLAAMKSRLHRARLRLMAALRKEPATPIEIRERDTMTCLEVLQCLGDYVDGHLDAPAIAAVNAHLDHCQRCAVFSGRYAGLLRQLPVLRQEPGAAIMKSVPHADSH
jgi:RNA polymerase sigma-70 factor (ECF subfamily)